MIKEAYCSYEVSKLLKEKGFNELCTAKYCTDGRFDRSFYYYKNSEINKDAYNAPTQQLAMQWLREVQYLWIDIDPLTNHKWTWSIWFMNDPKLKIGESSQVISTYEEACEAAIKYCLTNLI